MLEGYVFHTYEEFIDWWEKLNPADVIDTHEAKEIYFNLENYEEAI